MVCRGMYSVRVSHGQKHSLRGLPFYYFVKLVSSGHLENELFEDSTTLTARLFSFERQFQLRHIFQFNYTLFVLTEHTHVGCGPTLHFFFFNFEEGVIRRPL